jgi:hypothetical protein
LVKVTILFPEKPSSSGFCKKKARVDCMEEAVGAAVYHEDAVMAKPSGRLSPAGFH